MKKIPLLAGRCPYCLDEDQTVYGRLFLLILFLIIFFVIGNHYLDKGGEKKERKNIDEIQKLIDNL